MNASDKLARLLMTAEAIDAADRQLKDHAKLLLRRSIRELVGVADRVGMNILIVLNDPHEDLTMEVNDVSAAQNTDRLKDLVARAHSLVKEGFFTGGNVNLAGQDNPTPKEE